MFNEVGSFCICSFLAPYREVREKAKQVIGSERFLEVHVKASLEFCRSRDKDGLYEKAEAGEILDFPGVTTPYEDSENPDLVVCLEEDPLEECVAQIIGLMEERGFLSL